MDLKHFIRRQLKGKKNLKRVPKVLPPKNLEREYERQLVGILQSLNSLIESRVISQLPRWSKQFEQNRPANIKNDDSSDDIIAAMGDVKVALYRQYTPQEVERLARKVGMSVSDYNEYLLKNGMQKVLGFDVFFAQPYLKTELTMFSNLNASLITEMTDTAISRVQKDVMLGFSQGVRHEEIAKTISDYIDPLNGTIRSRARLIARDQVNKLNGQLTELRQSELGITRYVWRTVNDERVRESHAALDGKIFSWSEPPAEGNPGEPIQCRCYAEPVLSDLLESVNSPAEE
jgi:SPP1 gp7 family putative phage head morphogenesis protein